MKDEKTEKNKIENAPAKKSKKSKWTFLGLISAIIILGIYFLWRDFEKPVSGEIKVGKISEIENIDKIIYERLEGKYFSFHYNQKYALKNHNEEAQESGNILETAFLAQNDTNSKKIALTVESMEGRKIGDVGNYILRDRSPELYLKQKNTGENVESVSFSSKKDGILEKVYFIPKDSLLIELAFTGPIDESGEFEAEISDIIKSIQWRQ